MYVPLVLLLFRSICSTLRSHTLTKDDFYVNDNNAILL